jgi:hypothetical protein
MLGCVPFIISPYIYHAGTRLSKGKISSDPMTPAAGQAGTKTGNGTTHSCPVAGAQRDPLPGLVVQLVEILLDRELLAARRAAQGHRPSADLDHHVLAARPALHENLTINISHRDTECTEKPFITMEEDGKQPDLILPDFLRVSVPPWQNIFTPRCPA